MAMAGIIKKYKRTLVNFQEDFMIPFIYKAAHRYMQFAPERYPSVDVTFIPTATLGILAREFEQQQLIGLLQTLGPNTPVLPLLLKGILANSSITNRAELMTALDKMGQPDPQAAAVQQAQAQAQQELLQAQTADFKASAMSKAATAQKTTVEAQYVPQEVQAKLTAALSTNLEAGSADDKEFEKRARLADLMFKEKTLTLKQQDIQSNERIALAQMSRKKESDQAFSQALGG
jgi:hypothetical protein